jgi:hypothetical protein
MMRARKIKVAHDALQYPIDVQASIPKALRRFIRFTRVKTLKPGSATAVWAPDVGPPARA